jgi:hypothetical protein
VLYDLADSRARLDLILGQSAAQRQ